MNERFANDSAVSTLGAALTNSGTTLTFATGHGVRFPEVVAPEVHWLRLQDNAGANVEIVKVTAHTAGADTATIVRGQAGTTGVSHPIGENVYSVVTMETLESIRSAAITLTRPTGVAATDGPNIQAALTLAGARGGEVAITGGRWKANGDVISIPSGVTLNFVSRGDPSSASSSGTGTVLEKTSNGVLIDMSGASEAAMKRSPQLKNAALRGGDFTGPLIRTYHAVQAHMDNVECYGNAGPAWQVAHCWDTYVTNFFAEWCSAADGSEPSIWIRNSAAVSGFGFTSDSSNEINFTNLRLENFNGAAMTLERGTSNTSDQFNIRVNNYKFETSQTRTDRNVLKVELGVDIRFINGVITSIGYQSGQSGVGVAVLWSPQGNSTIQGLRLYQNAQRWQWGVQCYHGSAGVHELRNVSGQGTAMGGAVVRYESTNLLKRDAIQAENGEAESGTVPPDPDGDTRLFNKPPVRTVLTTNQTGTFTAGATVTTIAVGGTTYTVDGVAMANGDRVLLAGQTAALQNGIYVVSGVGTSVLLTRASDSNTSVKVQDSINIRVSEGTVNADSQWTLTTNKPITLNTTALTFKGESVRPWMTKETADVNLSAAAIGTYVAHNSVAEDLLTTAASPALFAANFFRLDPTLDLIPGRTRKLRIVATFLQNGVANSGTSVMTASLRVVTPGGTTTTWLPTFAGSPAASTNTAAQTGGAANSSNRVVSTEFDVPAAGTYAMVVGVATAATAGATKIHLELQERFV